MSIRIVEGTRYSHQSSIWKGIVEKSKDSVFHVHSVEEHGGIVQVGDVRDDRTKKNI